MALPGAGSFSAELCERWRRAQAAVDGDTAKSVSVSRAWVAVDAAVPAPAPLAVPLPPPAAHRGACTAGDVCAYDAALRVVAGGGALECVLDVDLFDALVRRLGERAQLALALHDECVRRLSAAGRARAATLKCMGLVGAAVGVVAGLPEAAWADVAIVETSTISGLQAKGAAALFGAPRSQNAFALDYHRGRERSRAALCAGGSECSVHGEVTQALTQQLLRALAAGRRGLDLSALSRERLGELVREAWAAAPRARAAAVALAPWLAYFHDRAPSNPLRGTCAEGVFMHNGWDAEQAAALLLPADDMQVVDFCASYSVRGRSETHQLAALFGVAWDEVVRRNAALTIQYVLAAMDGATVLHTNWDTEAYHRHLWWALGGADECAWRGLPALALAKPVTGEGYRGGAARLLTLGVQLATVVPLAGGERRVVRTLRLPCAPGVWSRPLATIGGRGRGRAACPFSQVLPFSSVTICRRLQLFHKFWSSTSAEPVPLPAVAVHSPSIRHREGPDARDLPGVRAHLRVLSRPVIPPR